MYCTLYLLAEQSSHFTPKVFSDTTINDKVDRRIENEEYVMNADEDIKHHRNVKSTLLATSLKVLHGVVFWMGEFVDLQGQSIRMTRDEYNHN